MESSSTCAPLAPASVLGFIPGIWWYLRTLGCSRDLADDLTQDTFVVALSGRLDDVVPTRHQAYLRQTARNLYIDHRRRTRKAVQPEKLDELQDLWRYYFESAHRTDPLDALGGCLELLAPRSRQALMAYYGDKKSREDLAHELGMKPTSVTKLLQRCKHWLRDCIKRRIERGE